MHDHLAALLALPRDQLQTILDEVARRTGLRAQRCALIQVYAKDFQDPSVRLYPPRR